MSQRLSAEFHDRSTMVSRNGSGGPSRVDSPDLEAATIHVDDDIEKSKTKSQRVIAAPLDRRESTIREAWPAPELKSDATLEREAELEEKDEFLVTFEDNDSLDPKVCLSSLSTWSYQPLIEADSMIRRTGQGPFAGICSYFLH